MRHRVVPDFDAVLAIVNDRRHERTSTLVRQHDGVAVAHGRDERIRRAEVDADRAPARVGDRRFTRLGDLK
jgi:hypothetical protein